MALVDPILTGGLAEALLGHRTRSACPPTECGSDAGCALGVDPDRFTIRAGHAQPLIQITRPQRLRGGVASGRGRCIRCPNGVS